MFLSKKDVDNLCTKRSVYFPLSKSPDVAWHIAERHEKVSRETTPVYRQIKAMFFKFLFILKSSLR